MPITVTSPAPYKIEITPKAARPIEIKRVGTQGPANSLSIGTVEKGDEAAATITGDAPSQTLNLTLPKGDTGDTGPGVPNGGSANQVLAKASSTDQDTQWVDTGDMVAATYDPNGVGSDAFDMGNMAEATDAKIMTAAERTKLAGIEEGATANSPDATLLDRANHTGTQSADTITDGTTNKAFTATEQAKLAKAVTNDATDASSFGFVLDEDDMASDSEQKVPTQQSVKAYVDSRADLSLAPYTGFIAHGRLPCAQNATYKQIASRTRHVARDNISSLQIQWANWWVDGDNAEAGLGADITLTASVEYPLGTLTPLTFSSDSSGTVPDGGVLTSDSVDISIPDGVDFWVRSYATSTAGILYADNMEAIADYDASGVTDVTASGTPVDKSDGNAWAYPPLAVLGTTTKPSILLLGDSRTQGFGDTVDDTLDVGNLARSLGRQFGVINAGKSSDKAQAFLASASKRVALAAHASHVIIEHGINDIGAGRTAAEVKADVEALIALFNKPVYVTTLEPSNSSTDNWATLANQTAASTDGARTSYNDYVRAGLTGATGHFDIADAVESSRNSGKWKVTGAAFGYVTNGGHENQVGYELIRDQKVIDPNVFLPGTPPRLATKGDMRTGAASDLAATPAGVREAMHGLGGYRNKIINGNFDIWQTGTSFSPATSYLADMWRAFSNGSSQAATRQSFALGQTDVPGNPKYYLQTVVTSVSGAGNLCTVQTKFEDVSTLSGEWATLTFYAKADATRNVALAISQSAGTGGSGGGDFSNQLISLSSNWKKYSILVKIPSISGLTLGTDDNVNISFWLDAGSNFDVAASSLGQQSGTFCFARMSLVAGDARHEADPFTARPIQQELALCQRYYEKSFPLATAPAQNAGTTGATTMPQIVGASTAGNLSHVSFKVPKRKTPTITLYNPAAANAQVRNITQSVDFSSSTATLAGENGFGISATSGAATASGQQCAVHWVADARI